MDDETDTPAPAAGTDNVEPSLSDTLDDTWDFHDPDLDGPDTEEAEVEDGTDDEEEGEAEDTPDEPEGDEEPEAEPEDTQQEPGEAAEDAKVRLADGSETTVGELIKGHMRQSDYTRKAQDVAERRKALEANASQFEGIAKAFEDHLVSLLPSEPDTGLLYSDPTKYYQQKGIYDQALGQVEKLIEAGKQAKTVSDTISQEDRQERLQTEFRALTEKFPEVTTKDGNAKFFAEVQEAATEIGYSPEEIAAADDHRLYALARWAKKGMDAEKARKTAREKVQKAPKAPPKRASNGQFRGQHDAMRKLAESGSIEDAIKALPD